MLVVIQMYYRQKTKIGIQTPKKKTIVHKIRRSKKIGHPKKKNDCADNLEHQKNINELILTLVVVVVSVVVEVVW